jgi:medium-chain acyl-[acyl-carrier-protein] hydrolase
MPHALNAFSKPSLWYPKTAPQPKAMASMLCFPFAGGSAATYRPWRPVLAHHGIHVMPVQLPGREKRIHEHPFTDMKSLVAAAMEALVPLPGPKRVLFGHSMGGLVAFELARSLGLGRFQGPDLLIISSCCAPHVRRWRPLTYNLPDQELAAMLQGYEGTAMEVLDDPELMRVLLPAVRSDLQLFETYLYGSRRLLNCPIVAIGGEGDPYVKAQDLEAWSELTAGPFKCFLLPGGHFYLLEHRQLLLAAIVREVTKL